jgi:hypothetical protein
METGLSFIFLDGFHLALFISSSSETLYGSQRQRPSCRSTH